MGGVDILVNNAGITKDGLFVRMSDKDWDDVIEVNLTSVFRLTRELAYPMMRRKGGRIINITSIVGVTGNPGQANYCASKAGMIGFTKSAGAGNRLAQRHGQLRRARLHRLGHDRQAERQAEGSDHGRHSRCGAWAPARKLPQRSCSLPATRRPTSPARPSTSMAAWR